MITWLVPIHLELQGNLALINLKKEAISIAIDTSLLTLEAGSGLL